MKYEPVKPFKDSNDLRKQIIKTCLDMRDKYGFFIGTWGNISVRVEEGMLVTPTRVSYDELKPEDIVVVTLDGKVMHSKRLPTSEVELHRGLLLKRPDIGAFIHSHSPYASAFACAHRSIPVVVDDMAEIIGGEVRCAAYVPAGRHREMANAVCEAINDDSFAVLISNHGAVVGGRDLDEATAASQILEKAALICIHAVAIGNAKLVPDDAWREERHRYLFKYGKVEDFKDILGK
jgi:L-fuculose-phosphate aldolase